MSITELILYGFSSNGGLVGCSRSAPPQDKQIVNSESKVFARLRELQKESDAQRKEISGYYDENFRLVVQTDAAASVSGIDFIEKKTDTIPFHVHVSNQAGERFDVTRLEAECNLDDMPSEADIISFLSFPVEQEIICTEQFIIRLRKTLNSPDYRQFSADFLRFCQSNPNLTRTLFDTMVLYQLYVQKLIWEKYAREELIPPSYKFFNSSSYMDICRDVFGITIEVYDRNLRLLSREEIASHYVRRQPTPAEKQQADEFYTKAIKDVMTAYRSR